MFKKNLAINVIYWATLTKVNLQNWIIQFTIHDIKKQDYIILPVQSL